MKLTRDEALKYHRMMWTDMQKELGDNPNGADRVLFKEAWCEEHFPDEFIAAHCFLCEYSTNLGIEDCRGGRYCLLVWPYGNCTTSQYYYDVPISEILALPEREVE